MQDAPSIWPALLAFAAVVALIPIALWALKRVQSGGPGTARVVTLVGGLNLGPRERIAVIESHGRRWMVGITGQSITLLAELDRDAAPATPDAPSGTVPNPFAQMLERLKRHG
jgi:flagellar protein FliO/FliZ